MENLLDYLLCALMGHNVTNVYSHEGRGHKALTVKSWTICLEDQVFFTLDKYDLSVIHSLYERRYEWMDDDERARYQKIFNACI